MSFFDEADEPPRTEVRASSRSAAGRRGSRAGGSGGSRRPGGRPPGGADQRSILVRRAVLVAVLIVVVVLIAVGVNSCEGSARKSALRDYANGVNAVIARSDSESGSLFDALSGKGGSPTAISQSVNQIAAGAQSTLSQAQGLSAPSSARTAQSHLVLAMQMRLNGLTGIAKQIQAALGNSVRTSAVADLAGQMARFYASDVVYKEYVAPELVSALHANAIAVGGSDGAPVNSGQFLPSVAWLTPAYIAGRLGVAISSGSGGTSAASKNGTGGLRGHSLTSVSVGGTALSTAGTNTISASPAPTFTLDFVNGGNYNEFDVGCEVKVTGLSDTGTQTVSETYAGKSATCSVTLPHVPTQGTYSVVATIEKVPGETNLANNTLSFPVTFN